MQEIKVPDIGNFASVDVIEVLAKVGDTVIVDQALITLESDKASIEVPSPVTGVLKSLIVKVGDKVSEGSLIAQIEVSQPEAIETAQPTPVALTPVATAVAAPVVAPVTTTAPVLASSTVNRAGVAHASPSVRAFARELGAELNRIQATGPKGRILREDVTRFVKGVMQGTSSSPASASATNGLALLPWPKIDFNQFGVTERKPLTRIQKLSGAYLARNWAMIPHVTQFDEVDITELEALRIRLNKENEKAGLKVTLLAFLMKAVVAALKKYPTFNSSLDGEELILKQYFHIGFAADTPNGLVVPVVRDCDQKGVLQIAQETAELAKLARDGKLKPEQMQGGCFSVSSLGGIGGQHFTPIVNAPEVAILGVSKGIIKPQWDGKQFNPCLMLPLSLSYDHRVIDGALGARFITFLNQMLNDMRRALI